ncbi:MAG: DciA family protein [Lysobacteraceae bacterium]
MQPDSAKPFRAPVDLLGTPDLAKLVDRIRWLEALDRRLRQSLPASLASQCRLANVREDRLVFLVQAPVWKARLRLHTDVLLDAARAAGLDIRTLTVKVATMPPVPPGEAPHTPLSAAARDALRAAAATTDDPELRDRLLALASLA